jgi:hypothetical protein
MHAHLPDKAFWVRPLARVRQYGPEGSRKVVGSLRQMFPYLLQLLQRAEAQRSWHRR